MFGSDQVVISAGGGALVRTVPAPGAPPGTEFLVTDLGVKYPLVDDTVASVLGYGHVSPAGIPSALLALLPGVAVHVWVFGPGLLLQIGLAAGFALLFEAALLRLE